VKKSRNHSGRKPSPNTVRNVLLITRVSTLRQADNDEGSLVNQLQRLRGYLNYRRSTGQVWNEVDVIELKGISGKDSIRSPEFQPVFDAILNGRANAVLCPALDRVCRNVADFLYLFAFLNHHDVEFISLRENFDTTTPQGQAFATIIMTLAQMEREITSLRTASAMADRAQRGLWNGGQILGFDPDPERPGYLIPNSVEELLVNLGFDTYLELGSIKETAETLNRRGYRTKSYTSRRGKFHSGTEFTISSMQYLLKNPAYIGKKEIVRSSEAGEERYLVDAVWPAIVDEEKFHSVQQLMELNGQSKRNGASSVQHVYSLGSLVLCGRCGSKMDGESATGRAGKKYHYYRCSNRECGMRVVARELEEAIVERLQFLSEDPELLEKLTAQTNRKLQQGKPRLERQRAKLEKDLNEVKSMGDKLVTELASLNQGTGRVLIRTKLNELGHRQLDLEHGLAEVQQELESLDHEAVDAEQVRMALGQVKELFGALKPYQQKELIQLVLKAAEVNEREIVLEVYALSEGSLAGKLGGQVEVVRTRPGWLPTLVSHRTIRVSFKCHLPSLSQLSHRETNRRIKQGTGKVVAQWRRPLDDGIVKNQAQLAQREGLSRARITRALHHT
jgi:site-specific DNA recombinase